MTAWVDYLQFVGNDCLAAVAALKETHPMVARQGVLYMVQTRKGYTTYLSWDSRYRVRPTAAKFHF